MSIKIMSWVWDNSPYEGKALLIHLALADFANDAGECWPSQVTIAAKARCTERHVRDTISQMSKDGYIEYVHISNGASSNRYRLLSRNSVPPRKSKTTTPELDDQKGGNPSPENRQEPSITISKVACPYCHRKFSTDKPHNCSAMNQLIR